VRSAKKIVTARRVHALNFDDLKRLGVVLKRAKYFITCSGKYFEKMVFDQNALRVKMIGAPGATAENKSITGVKRKKEDEGQLSLFEKEVPHDVSANIGAAITGEF
jgi:predicted DNA-binding helix-hairpin-helix protein